MPNTVDLVKTVKVSSATAGKAQRMLVTAERTRGITPPPSSEELQRRQDEVRKTRRPAGPEMRRTRAALVVEDEAVPDVEETGYEEEAE